MSKKFLGAVLSLAICSTPVFAHDVWFEPDGKNLRLVYGHPGELEPYDPGKTKAVVAIGKDGKQRKVSPHIHDQTVSVQSSADATLITVDFDNGFWTETTDEQHLNKSKKDVPNAKSASHSKKFHKLVVSWSDAAAKPVGADFEIVPLANPLSLKPGDELPVQVLYKSKPLAGAEVEIMGSMDLFETDAQGKTTLPITEAGFQYIQVSHQEKLNSPDADVLSLSTNLTFNL